MCEHCDSTVGRVARELGMEADAVRRVLDTYADERGRESAHEAEATGQALSAMMGRQVHPVLLGLEPFILVTARGAEDLGEATRVVLAVEFGGGITPEVAERFLADALDSWKLRGSGGVTADGALIEWLGEVEA